MTETKVPTYGGRWAPAQRRPQQARRPGPGVIMVSGRRVITLAGYSVAPMPGPAHEMLDRLSIATGNNGLVLLADSRPDWRYLLADDGPWHLAGGPAWYTATRGQTKLRLALVNELRPENNPLMGPDAQTTVNRHTRFADLAGVPFYGDGGGTGGLLMEETVKIHGGNVLRGWRDEAAPVVNEASWLGPWESADYGATIALDKNAYYLCAAGLTLLPADGLTRTEGRPDPASHVGYWKIRTPANPDKRLPHPLGHGHTQPGVWTWVAHPTMELLAELGLPVEVCDSWTCPRARARRLLVPWYERLREARAAAAALPADDDTLAIRAAIKDTYSRGIGCLNRPTRRWFRPDWRAMLYAQARCNMYRALRKAGQLDGRWPACTRTDSVQYEGAGVPASFKLGPDLGAWRVVR